MENCHGKLLTKRLTFLLEDAVASPSKTVLSKIDKIWANLFRFGEI